MDGADLSEQELSQLDPLVDGNRDSDVTDESIESTGTDASESAAHRLSAERFLAGADRPLRRLGPGRLVLGPAPTTLRALIGVRELALTATKRRIDGDDR